MHAQLRGQWKVESLNGLLKFSAVILAVLAILPVILAVTMPFPFEGAYSLRGVAYISGLLALYLIIVSGLMMLFKKDLLALSKDPRELRLAHLVVSAIGGVFLTIHISLLLPFPMTLTVLLGYLGTGAALVVWITGMAVLAERHAPLVYHSVFSVAGVALIMLHAYGISIFRNAEVSFMALALCTFVLVVLLQSNLRLYLRRYGIGR